jgi:tetratricopeptide (TPR) repeat protein/tRNA A-37 threonylcarbamoyl transferase component Bud32
VTEETLLQEALAKSPSERAAFLEQTCAVRPELRAAVLALWAAHEKYGDVLNETRTEPGSTGEPEPGPATVAATLDFTPKLDPPHTTAPDADHPFAPTLDPLGTHPYVVSAPQSDLARIDTRSASSPRVQIAGYDILQELGRGGMGVVYKARHQKLGHEVALKMVLAGGLASTEDLARFQLEAAAVARLNHPGIVHIHEFGDYEGKPFFSLEYVAGGSLARKLKAGALPAPTTAALVQKLATAIAHAHEHGIIHRDLKPANVLLTLQGEPKITDFGLAKDLQHDAGLSGTGQVMGTPSYMAPEQAEGRVHEIGPATDVYALGVILYQCLAGKVPFKGTTLHETLKLVVTQEPEKPRRLQAEVPRDLETICLRCLEKEPRQRYATASDLADELGRFLRGEPVAARPVGRLERGWRWCRRNPAVASLLTAVAASLLLGAGVAMAFAIQANRRAAEATTERDRANEERARAEAHETQAIDAVKKFRDAVAGEPELKNTPQLERLRKRLLKEPLAFFHELRDRLQADADTRPESLARLAQASYDLGQLTSEIGNQQDALSAYRDALSIRQKLADANPSDTDLQVYLGCTQHEMGALLEANGKSAEALQAYQSALAILQKLANAQPADPMHQKNLANCHNSIGVQLHTIGKPAEAQKAWESALAILQKLADANPSDTDLQSRVATTHLRIGTALSDTAKQSEALRAMQSALVILQKMADTNPSITHFQRSLANCQNNIGGGLRATGKPAKALIAYRSALTIQQKLAGANPTVTGFQSDLTQSHINIGRLLEETGKPAEALTAYESALAIQQKLADANPTVTRYQSDLALIHNNRGLVLSNTGKPLVGLKSLESARAICQKLADANPSITEFQSNLARSHNNLGIQLLAVGRPAEALKAYESALAIRQKLARDHPESPNLASSMGATLHNLASLDLTVKRFTEGRDRLRQAIAWQQKALAMNPAHLQYRQFMANHLTNLIFAARGLGDSEGMAEAERELAKLRASDPVSAALDARLAAIVKGNEQPRDEMDRLRLAQRAYDKALHGTAARLWGEALAKNPKLGDNLQAGRRYNAACAAARAGCGNSKDDPPPDDASKVKLRRAALDWLRVELAAYTRVYVSRPAAARGFVQQQLEHWQQYSDLAGIRDAAALAKLPADEQKAWTQLWADVASLLKKAEDKK